MHNRLNPGQLPSNSTAALRSILFATQTIIPNQKQTNFQGFEQQTTLRYIFRKLPSIQWVNMQKRLQTCW